MSIGLSIAIYEAATCIMGPLSSSTKNVEFDFSVSIVPSAVNVSTGSVVAISNVKRFCGPSHGNDMIMPIPAVIELNVRLLLNILNVILAVSVFDGTNDEVEPSTIRYCEDVPPLLTIELAVIVQFTCNVEVGVVVPIPTIPV